MRLYNITKIGFPSERLREMCIDNFNAISASIKSVISQVRTNKSRIDRNEETLSRAVITDANGNIAYGGATLPTSLDDTNWIHYAYPNGHFKIVNKSNGATFLTVNAYITIESGVWRAVNTGYSSLIYIGSDFVEERISTTNVVTVGSGGDTVSWKKVRRTSRVAEGGAGAYDLQIATGASVVAQL